jgi:hypothetical protein
MDLHITISGVEKKTRTARRQGQVFEEPIIRFCWSLLDGSEVLLSHYGWLMGPERIIASPRVFSFGRKPVKIHDVSGRLANNLSRVLSELPEVVTHLGPEPGIEKQVTVRGEQKEVKV